ncbi:MAG: aminotransferase class I/II-fold pyridoxal phosphate-dependent enzyme [Oligoflexia bacterium]|nr:aminotransferase class I/II-fold pyridoxal phosphate-dependent enzyme [Oligoflexia bacterium]
MSSQLEVISRFPNIGQTIFSKISALSNQKKAINLGQGFPNFEGDEFLYQRLKYYIDHGQNQYAPMTGMPKLREIVTLRHQEIYGNAVHPQDEVTITAGATVSIFCALSALVSPGDEVISFDPSYDSYTPNIELLSGVSKRINLTADFQIDWDLVKKTVTSKTKVILLNTPHNPAGSVLTQDDLDKLWDIVKDKNIFIISDEVYQHIIFDGKKHLSPFNDERMRNRSIAISSFGKSFHVTGWKVGYVLSSKELMTEFRKVYQFISFTTFAAPQSALADMMEKNPNYFQSLAKFYQQKRDFLRDGLSHTKFKVLPCEGSFFQLADYSEISDKEQNDFVMDLIDSPGVATIPISGFYQSAPKSQKVIRFCFAKTEEVLAQAIERLKTI